MAIVRPAVILFATLTLTGCAATPTPKTAANSVTVARLNPEPGDVPPDPARPLRYGVEVLAQRTVADADTARRMRQAVTDPANRDGPAHGRCFLPRLFVRIADGPRWTDYVICTQCRRMEIHGSDGTGDAVEISPEGTDVFDVLTAGLFPGFVARHALDKPAFDQP